MSEHKAAKTPLIDLLRYVPVDTVGQVSTPTSSQNIPYGRLCHEAAERIAALEAVAEAAVCWWEMHRPKDFSAAQHLQNPRINTIRGSSGHLATVVAQYLSAAGYGHTEGEG